jgi:hypothetical protein
MSEPPGARITRGNPTPDEERAVREAIVALWRADQSEAARNAAGAGGWRSTAWSEATGSSMWGARSWRESAGLTQPGVLPARRVGRGDQR